MRHFIAIAFFFPTFFTFSFSAGAKTNASTAIQTNGVAFQNIKDGATLTSPVKVTMAVYGKKLLAAGEKVDDKNLGHHHLLIDAEPIPEGQPIPSDEHHLHFGKGQTETEIKLAPGQHKLTLQFADGAHRSYGSAWASSVTITVK